MTFEELGLSPALLQAVQEKGYSEPSPIQAKAIPAVLSGKDVMAAAQTGTGKTAGFTLPILQRLQESAPLKPHRVRALVLTPTRELAAQIGYWAGMGLSALISLSFYFARWESGSHGRPQGEGMA